MSETATNTADTQPLAAPDTTAPGTDAADGSALAMETVEVDAPAPKATVDDDHQHANDQGFKDAFRAHARWALAEMQLCAEGKTIEDREKLNP